MSQALVLAKKPHILIATPGRLVDHLENTKGFNLRSLKFLVSDITFLLSALKKINIFIVSIFKGNGRGGSNLEYGL